MEKNNLTKVLELLLNSFDKKEFQSISMNSLINNSDMVISIDSIETIIKCCIEYELLNIKIFENECNNIVCILDFEFTNDIVLVLNNIYDRKNSSL